MRGVARTTIIAVVTALLVGGGGHRSQPVGASLRRTRRTMPAEDPLTEDQMEVDVLAEPDGKPRCDVTIHRAGSLDCPGRRAYEEEYSDGPGYVRVDDEQLDGNQLLCHHPCCFQKTTPKGATLQRLRDRRRRFHPDNN